MSIFERYLTLWVALCIVAGIALGHVFPSAFHVIGAAEVARVNLPVAVLIWLMIIPMLVKIDFAALARVKEHWRGIGVTLFINWAVKPFSMAFLGWLFIRRRRAAQKGAAPESAGETYAAWADASCPACIAISLIRERQGGDV